MESHSKNRLTFQHYKKSLHIQRLARVSHLTLAPNKGQNPNTVTLKKYFRWVLDKRRKSGKLRSSLGENRWLDKNTEQRATVKPSCNATGLPATTAENLT